MHTAWLSMYQYVLSLFLFLFDLYLESRVSRQCTQYNKCCLAGAQDLALHLQQSCEISAAYQMIGQGNENEANDFL